MDRFNELSVICTIATVLAFLGMIAGLFTSIFAFAHSTVLGFYVLGTSIGGGFFVVIVAGSVKVLIGIYENTLVAKTGQQDLH